MTVTEQRSLAEQQSQQVFYTWTAQAEAVPLAITGGRGARFHTEDGAEWIDLGSMVWNAHLGHGHPVMQRALVEERRWIGQNRFLHALSYCMLLPGPEAHQLAVYVGWLLNGVRGGVVAGVLFVLPGVVAMLALSALYVGLGDTTVAAAIAIARIWRQGRTVVGPFVWEMARSQPRP